MTATLDRRRLLTLFGGTVALAATGPALAQPIFSDDPFSLGVASGEPTADGFVIWTRLAPRPLEFGSGMPMSPIGVDWQVATDDGFRNIVARGTEVARPELGHSLHVEVSGLQPATPYWYRFNAGRERSAFGRAKTTPRAGAPTARVRLAAAGCQHYEQGLYTAYRHLSREEDLDFVFHYGDYIYEGRASGVYRSREGGVTGNPRRYVGDECYSLDDYRRRYAQTTSDLDLQNARQAAPWFASFDDHEVDNNWAADVEQDDAPADAFRLRRAMAFQAWWENMPVRRSMLPAAGAISAYRRARYGDLLDAHVLDTRQYRTDQPCGDGFRTTCPARTAAEAQMLGSEQERWLDASLRQRGARWALLAQQVMVTALDRRREQDGDGTLFNLDSWAGYEAPRQRLLERAARHGSTVILTGDEHQNYANEATLPNGRVAAAEFVATSISSGGDGREQRAGTPAFLARNPQCKFNNDRRGYILCDITPERWRTDFRVVDRVSTPGGEVSTRTSFAVAPGRPALQAA